VIPRVIVGPTWSSVFDFVQWWNHGSVMLKTIGHVIGPDSETSQLFVGEIQMILSIEVLHARHPFFLK
jgi:hypothetical protein